MGGLGHVPRPSNRWPSATFIVTHSPFHCQPYPQHSCRTNLNESSSRVDGNKVKGSALLGLRTFFGCWQLRNLAVSDMVLHPN